MIHYNIILKEEITYKINCVMRGYKIKINIRVDIVNMQISTEMKYFK